MPASSLDELFQLERWLEEGFRYGVALSVVPFDSIDISRQSNAANSPRVELKAIIGEESNHHHLINGSAWLADAWKGELEALVVTNRQLVQDTTTHVAMLGKLRACVKAIRRVQSGHAPSNVNPLAWWNQDYIAITDIRQIGTDDSWDDGKDLDYTKLRFGLEFNIRPTAWPI